MKERPINFKAREVQAIRNGRKTQFRRVVKPQPIKGGIQETKDDGIFSAQTGRSVMKYFTCPYGADGDRLWVRETWAQLIDEEGESKIYYSATEKDEVVLTDGDGFREWHANGTPKSPWRSPVCMPRWASRITLEVVSVRVERLQDISEEDAKAEGVQRGAVCDDAQCDDDFGPMNFVDGYQIAWEADNGPGSWDENPFVWVVEFRQV